VKHSKWWTPLTWLREVAYSDFLHMEVLVVVLFRVYLYLTQHHLPLVHHRFIHSLFFSFKSNHYNTQKSLEIPSRFRVSKGKSIHQHHHHGRVNNALKIRLIFALPERKCTYKITQK